MIPGTKLFGIVISVLPLSSPPFGTSYLKKHSKLEVFLRKTRRIGVLL